MTATYNLITRSGLLAQYTIIFHCMPYSKVRSLVSVAASFGPCSFYHTCVVFCRLINDEERAWTDENINAVAVKYFPNIDTHASLQRPILYSNWLSKDYVPVDREDLREYVQARLKVFYEEELDVPLVLFNEVFDHVLRIDRILRQSQGHLLLIGVSGAGKTTLTRFVAWINGLSIFQIKVHNKYTAAEFDDDLRNVLRRAGCKVDQHIVHLVVF